MIQVNQVQIEEQQVLQEMQYHSAGSQRDAMIKAAESLVITELVKQRADKLKVTWVDGEEENNIQALLDEEVVIPSADEVSCLKYFEQNPSRFTTTPLLSVSHILLACPPEDDKGRIESRDIAKGLIKELQGKPQLFAKLAAAHSKCPSSKTQGSLGQISKGQTVPEFERQLFNCSEGLVNTPIESRYGIHIVKIDKRVEGKPLEYSMVSNRINTYLNEKVRRKTIAQYIQELISAANIKGFDFSVAHA